MYLNILSTVNIFVIYVIYEMHSCTKWLGRSQYAKSRKKGDVSILQTFLVCSLFFKYKESCIPWLYTMYGDYCQIKLTERTSSGGWLWLPNTQILAHILSEA